MNSALVIFEGAGFEKIVIEDIFLKLGFKTVTQKRHGQFNVDHLIKDDHCIYLIPGPKTQVVATLKEFDKYSEDLPKYFGINGDLGLIFIVYDVDTVQHHTLEKHLDYYNSPQDGLLILSNPCLEVLVDDTLLPHTGVPHLYKDAVRKQLINTGKLPATISHKHYMKFIKNHIFELLEFHVKRNTEIYKSDNVLDHIAESHKDLKSNLHDPTLLHFYYEKLFTTIYVMIAEILGVTRVVNNAELLISKWNDILAKQAVLNKK